MMPSTDQPRWISHPHNSTGISSSTHHPDVSVHSGSAFSSGNTPSAHHSTINSYIEPGGYLEDMENYLHHGQPGYYGLNMQQYRAVHHRTISGKSNKVAFFATSYFSYFQNFCIAQINLR